MGVGEILALKDVLLLNIICGVYVSECMVAVKLKARGSGIE